MPEQPSPLIVKPGVDLQATPALLELGWSSSSLIRWQKGLLQKLGGSTAMNPGTPFAGVCRGMRSWSDLTGTQYTAVGTTQRLEVLSNTVLSDITPLQRTGVLTTPFSTTAGSKIVSVADGGGDISAGNWINIENATYVGGLLLQGFYLIGTIIAGGYQITAPSNASATTSGVGTTLAFTTAASSHTVTVTAGAYVFTNGQSLLVWFTTSVGGTTVPSGTYTVAVSGGIATITVPNAATSVATVSENGGNVSIAYLIATAIEVSSGSGPYGSGPYGEGPYGTSSGPSPFGGYLRQWSMDTWGQDLLAGIVSGTMYYWTPPVAIGNVAVPIPNAPKQATGFFVVQPTQQIMAYGITDPNTNNQEPLLIGFCDVGNFSDWTPTATNQAGTFPLTSGNQIITGLAVGLVGLLWTDTDLWIAQYLGFPLIWGFNRVAPSAGAWCRRGAVAIGNQVWWIGSRNFWVFDGARAAPMPCPVWDFVFDNIDQSNLGAAFMAANPLFNEWFFFFPTKGSQGQVTSYVKFNYQDQCWDIGAVGALERSAWTADGPFTQSISADYNGLIQQQESGTDNNDVPYDSFAQTGWIPMAEGAESQVLKWFWPDFILSGGNVEVTISFCDYPDNDANNPVRVYGPYTVTPMTPYFFVNGRGRFFSVKVESNILGVFWRLGRCRVVIQPDGKGP